MPAEDRWPHVSAQQDPPGPIVADWLDRNHLSGPHGEKREAHNSGEWIGELHQGYQVRQCSYKACGWFICGRNSDARNCGRH